MMQSFGDVQFHRYSSYIYDKFGIYFSEEKKELLHSKLLKLLVKNKFDSYDSFFRLLEQGADKKYLIELANEITINKTNFFREIEHFDFIKNKISQIMEKNKRIGMNNEIRVWSAGCSTGEEPYTLAIVLRDCLPGDIKIKILATDLSNRVLSSAKKGLYSAVIRDEIEQYHIVRNFKRASQGYEVTDAIRKMVTFRSFNLANPFPFSNPFDIIFCRNVMIYFDLSFQQSLIEKFYDALTQGGLLFIGHSESLTNKKHKFQYVQPAVYMK